MNRLETGDSITITMGIHGGRGGAQTSIYFDVEGGRRKGCPRTVCCYDKSVGCSGII